MERHFELSVLTRKVGYGLQLSEEKKKQPIVRIWGNSLHAVLDHVLKALQRSGYQPSSLSSRRRKPYQLKEEEAVRLGLLFKAVKPLRKHNRIEKISNAIGHMETEEVYYWFSKCTQEGNSQRACRSFRILEAAE